MHTCRRHVLPDRRRHPQHHLQVHSGAPLINSDTNDDNSSNDNINKNEHANNDINTNDYDNSNVDYDNTQTFASRCCAFGMALAAALLSIFGGGPGGAAWPRFLSFVGLMTHLFWLITIIMIFIMIIAIVMIVVTNITIALLL